MTNLFLVRHGETDWNRDRRIQGSTDIPLNDTGREQARDAAAALREELGSEAPIVVSSDLGRARETAAIIADALGVPLGAAYPEVRERAYGDAEGVGAAEFIERWGDWHSAEIPHAETWAHLRARAIRGMRRIARDVRRGPTPAASVVVVTHGALIREVIRHATAGALPPVGERLANGASFRFLLERERLTMHTYAGAALPTV